MEVFKTSILVFLVSPAVDKYDAIRITACGGYDHRTLVWKKFGDQILLLLLNYSGLVTRKWNLAYGRAYSTYASSNLSIHKWVLVLLL